MLVTSRKDRSNLSSDIRIVLNYLLSPVFEPKVTNVVTLIALPQTLQVSMQIRVQKDGNIVLEIFVNDFDEKLLQPYTFLRWRSFNLYFCYPCVDIN